MIDQYTKRAMDSSSGYADEHTAFVDERSPGENEAVQPEPFQGEHVGVDRSTPVPAFTIEGHRLAPPPKPKKKRYKSQRTSRVGVFPEHLRKIHDAKKAAE